MPRSRQPSEPALSPQAQKIAEKKHPLNVLVTELDFKLLEEAARLEPEVHSNVSRIVRVALLEYLDNHPQNAAITHLAYAALELDAQREALHQQYQQHKENQ